MKKTNTEKYKTGVEKLREYLFIGSDQPLAQDESVHREVKSEGGVGGKIPG